MKKFTFFLPAIMFIYASLPALSQKYTTAADTVKLNKEYVEVSNEIADLTSKLTIAQNNLPGYRSNVDDATSDAKITAIKSSEQASNAINGNVGDARKAKRKAKQALRDAKDVQHAHNKVEGEDKKITKLTAQLKAKQEKLQELENMRTTIRNIQ